MKRYCKTVLETQLIFTPDLFYSSFLVIKMQHVHYNYNTELLKGISIMRLHKKKYESFNT